VPDMDHERAAADRGAVDPISGWKSALIRVSVHICTKDGIDPRLVAALAAERIFTKCTYGCADVKPLCLVAGLNSHVQRRRFGLYGLAELTSRSTQPCGWLWLSPACQAPSRKRTLLTSESQRQRHWPPGGKPSLLWPPN
jgi:hypothetical protein